MKVINKTSGAPRSSLAPKSALDLFRRYIQQSCSYLVGPQLCGHPVEGGGVVGLAQQGLDRQEDGSHLYTNIDLKYVLVTRSGLFERKERYTNNKYVLILSCISV